MAKRKIILIDEEKCNGCGQCLPGCPEGALQVVEGKARLVKESYCDGLGACLGHCPQGALQVVERDAEEYDVHAVLAHLEKQSPELAKKHLEHMRAHGLGAPDTEQAGLQVGCPSKQVLCWGVEGVAGQTGHSPESTLEKERPQEQAESTTSFSALSHWPVKLRLIPPNAGFLKNADLVFMADCVPFAYGNMQKDFIKGRVVAAGCPKFDDAAAYVEKIKTILESVNLKSITVVYMEVPCCSGFVRIVREALEKSGVDIPLETVQIGIRGDVMRITH